MFAAEAITSTQTTTFIKAGGHGYQNRDRDQEKTEENFILSPLFITESIEDCFRTKEGCDVLFSPSSVSEAKH